MEDTKETNSCALPSLTNKKMQAQQGDLLYTKITWAL